MRWLVLLLLFYCNDLQAETELKDLNKMRECIDSYNMAIDRIDSISENWFTNPESSLNIITNYEFVRSRSDLLRTVVIEYVNKPYDQAENFDQLSNIIKDSYAASDEILEQIDRQTDLEDKFNDSLFQIGSGLEEVGSEINSANAYCKSFGTVEFEKILSAIADWRIHIKDMRGYLKEASKKTWLLFTAGVAFKRISAQEVYARKISKPISELKEQIEGVLAASLLFNRIKIWWLKTGLEPGVARGNMTRFYQYSDSLLYLQLDLVQIKSFEEKLDKISDISDSLKTSIKDELNNIKGVLTKAQNDLQEDGRQYMHVRQLALATRRVELGEQVGKKCLVLAKNFIAVSKLELDAEIFEKLDSNFLRQTTICQRRQ